MLPVVWQSVVKLIILAINNGDLSAKSKSRETINAQNFHKKAHDIDNELQPAERQPALNKLRRHDWYPNTD
jgi:hypothetical protein